MTIRDLLNAGIQIQGATISIETIKGYKNIVLYSETDELLAGNNPYLDMEVSYIYPSNNSLVIEVTESE